MQIENPYDLPSASLENGGSKYSMTLMPIMFQAPSILLGLLFLIAVISNTLSGKSQIPTYKISVVGAATIASVPVGFAFMVIARGLASLRSVARVWTLSFIAGLAWSFAFSVVIQFAALMVIEYWGPSIGPHLPVTENMSIALHVAFKQMIGISIILIPIFVFFTLRHRRIQLG